jgi:hypothetical protein
LNWGSAVAAPTLAVQEFPRSGVVEVEAIAIEAGQRAVGVTPAAGSRGVDQSRIPLVTPTLRATIT